MGQCGRSDPAAAFVSGMLKAANIILVGPMGSGKSAVGRLLARRLGLSLVDARRLLEEDGLVLDVQTLPAASDACIAKPRL